MGESFLHLCPLPHMRLNQRFTTVFNLTVFLLLASFATAPRALCRPILSVDFNCGSTGPSPTEGGFLPFAPVSASSQAGPVSKSFPGLDSTLTTGSVSVTLAAGTSVTATGNLTSRDRTTMAEPEFSHYYLYRDFVTSTSGPLTVGVSGLAANKTYDITFYVYDNVNSRSFSIVDYTSGSAGTSSSISSTAGYTFTGGTAAGIFAVTQSATSNATGNLVFRITKTDAINSALICGLNISVTPSTWYLTTTQAGSENWGTGYLNSWNSNSSGTGSAPTGIHVGGSFVHDKSGYQLRTLGGASTFAGGTLTINGSAKLILKTTNGTHISTIPFLETGGGVFEQGYSGITQNLTVGSYAKNTGTTSLTAGSGRGIRLAVGQIYGSSAFTLSGGGSFILNLQDASDYTGAINLTGGSLVVDQLLSTGGALNISSGTQVSLQAPAYFTSININGTALTAGIHTYASLNAAYPAIFTSGTAAGSLTVYSAGSPASMRGVNLAGGEFGTPPGTYGVSYKYPTAAYFDYYQSKGLTLMRVPFRWERVQPTLNAALDATEMGRLDAVIDLAEARGMKVVLDMHNYARHNGNIIGSVANPVSAYRDVWRRLADHFKGETAIYGYGLMNEPNGTNGVWAQAAQEATYGIREVDASTFVIVNGDVWGAAYGWEVANATLTVADPVQRLIYEAHCYFDSEGGGSYGTYEAEGAYPEIGVDRVRPFITWLRATGRTGYVGEYGVPRGDSRWNVVLDNFLTYIANAGLSGTYWAGGPGWGATTIQNPYGTICEPYGGVDAPQMSVIADHP
jgi:aryl-phospho-beta-D-glucosidase BglC (GH1 family)